MYREAVICVITVVIILIINMISDNYTKESVKELTEELGNLRTQLLVDNVEHERVEEKIKYIFERWNDRYKILAYYLEHDELEKVETNLNSLLGEIETKEYEEAVSELDKTNFILHHIERKNKVDLKNIF